MFDLADKKKRRSPKLLNEPVKRQKGMTGIGVMEAKENGTGRRLANSVIYWERFFLKILLENLMFTNIRRWHSQHYTRKRE